ncbi:MAG: hypothetical protein M3O70_09095 [Actinomycetota bacterium]|nr:hypothetical protein [Actinomycetota bacterium]
MPVVAVTSGAVEAVVSTSVIRFGARVAAAAGPAPPARPALSVLSVLSAVSGVSEGRRQVVDDMGG